MVKGLPTHRTPGLNRAFRFDLNSTENEGRFRICDPDQIEEDSYFRRKSSTPGISYVMGKDKDTGEVRIQAIRFDKSKITEPQAAKWWKTKKKDLLFGL